MVDKQKIRDQISAKEREIESLRQKLQEKNYTKQIYANKLDELHLEEDIIQKLDQLNKRIDKLEYAALNHRKESPEYFTFLEQLEQFRDDIRKKEMGQKELQKWKGYVNRVEKQLRENLEVTAREKAQIAAYLQYMKRLIENSADYKALEKLEKIDKVQKSSFEHILGILDRFPWYFTMIIVPVFLGFATGMAVNYVSNSFLGKKPEPTMAEHNDSRIIKAIAQNNHLLLKELLHIVNVPSLSTLVPVEGGEEVIHFGKKETHSYEEQKLIDRIKSLPSNQHYVCVIEGYASQEKIYNRTDFNSNYELATARALNTKFLILKNLNPDTFLQFLINTKVDVQANNAEARRVVVTLYRR